MNEDTEAIWVQIRTSQEVVEIGLRTILENAAEPQRIVTSGLVDTEADIALYDVILLHDNDGEELEKLLSNTATCVIAIDRTLAPALGARAREFGVEWSITLGITSADLVQLVHDAAAGHLDDSPIVREWEPGETLGHEAGLSRREAETLQLVVLGLTNREIADQQYLSINSVKTYIRSTYRKIGVASRAQAVAWGIRHGFPSTEHPGSPHRRYR